MTWLLIAISWAVGFFHFLTRPQKIPIHWNLKGVPDNFLPFPWGVVFYPATITALGVFLEFVPKIDPYFKKDSRLWKITKALLISFILAFQLLALLNRQKLSGIFPLLAGIFFIAFGNVLPTIPRNFFVGIRTPWTLASEKVWVKTHRVGGYTSVGAGLLLMGSSLLPAELQTVVCLLIIIGWATFCFVYSFVVWKLAK